MKTILLTGAGGMVGRNILEARWANDYRIFSPTRTELDLLDFSAVKKTLNEVKPDFVIHAAGHVGGIQANIREPVKFLLDNLEMGKNVVVAAKETGVKNLLNLGSSCMYPRNLLTPLTEDKILSGELEPTNEGYAIAKIAVAKLCQFVTQTNPQLNFRTIIPCNLYGRWDKFDTQRSHMIPAVISKISHAIENDLSEVEIWGDGKARREFMYSGDLAEFIGQSLLRFTELPQYMNVALGYDYTINDYYQTISEILGWKGRFLHDLSKPAGMARKLCDVTLLNKFGWQAATSLREGLKQTV